MVSAEPRLKTKSLTALSRLPRMHDPSVCNIAAIPPSEPGFVILML